MLFVDSKLQNFATNFSTSKLFPCLAISKMLLSPDFLLSLFASPWHNALLLEEYNILISKIPKLPVLLGGISPPILRPILVPLSRLVICGIMLLLVLDGFIWMPWFVLYLKSILFSSQLSRLLKENYLSSCPFLLMEVISWLVWMSISSELALLIASSSDPIVISDNKIFYILV